MTATEPAPDQEQLAQSAQSGDPRAFEALYRATSGTVYGLCLRMTASPSLAEECVQQTYIQAWRNLNRFRGESSVSTWLHRIAVNEVLGQFRREQRHDLPVDDIEPAGQPLNHGRTLDLERAIAALPVQARSVFVLVGVYGHSHEEAASMLDIAVGTSKAHYHHARRRLRESLGPQQSDGEQM